MSQQNQPYSSQPWSHPDGQDASPWAERDGQPGLGGHGQTLPPASLPPNDAGGYGAAPSPGTSGPGVPAPYGQPYGAGGRPTEPSGQAAPQQYGPQHYEPQHHEPQQYATTQYATTQYGTTQYGPSASQPYPPTPYPPTPYGQPQQYPGQYVGAQPARPRPVWKKVVGIVLAIWSGLALLSALSQVGSMVARASSRGVAYQFGSLLGLLLMVVLPAVLAWLLLRRPR